jgi:hypothetical protein
MIINIFSVFFLIKNISIRYFNIPLLIFLLFIFFSAELKVIIFITCFTFFSIVFSKLKNRYIFFNALIFYFLLAFFLLVKSNTNLQKYNFFSSYALKDRVDHFINNDYNYLINEFNKKHKNIFVKDLLEKKDIQSKSLTSRVTNYLFFVEQLKESSTHEIFFGRGAFFNGRFYFHNFFLDIVIKFGLLSFIIWFFYLFLFAFKYFLLIKKNLLKFLFSIHFYCFYLFFYFNLSFAAWNSKFLFSFLGISYFLINSKKSLIIKKTYL